MTELVDFQPAPEGSVTPVPKVVSPREWWWPRCDRCGRWMRFEDTQTDPDDPRYPVNRHVECGAVAATTVRGVRGLA